MSDDGDAFEYTVKLQRGEGTDDRDTHKTKVTANTIEELKRKVASARELLEREIEQTRDIQPGENAQSVADKHQTFDDYAESQEGKSDA